MVKQAKTTSLDINNYVNRLMELEEYRRKIIAFKLVDDIPSDAKKYGDDISFLCAIVPEVWEEKIAYYLTNKNIVCGGAVYAGLGTKKMTKEDFDTGMEAVIGKNLAYCSRKVLRRVNQQIPHFFKPHKYMVLGPAEQVLNPDMLMVVADVNKIMRLCKAYTWKTGELVKGVQGTAWCAQSFPYVYRNKTMTYNLGDPPSRTLMQLEDNEMYCMIHASLFPLIVDNLANISSGDLL